MGVGLVQKNEFHMAGTNSHGPWYNTYSDAATTKSQHKDPTMGGQRWSACTSMGDNYLLCGPILDACIPVCMFCHGWDSMKAGCWFLCVSCWC
jgi:hypothetical protein